MYHVSAQGVDEHVINVHYYYYYYYYYFALIGTMELRVGSNIMIHFVYILLLLYFLCVYVIHC